MNRQRSLQPQQENHQSSQPILVSVVRVARTATTSPSDAMSSSSETPTLTDIGIDSRCSGSLSHLSDYELWWVHQNATNDAERSLKVQRRDAEARCNWPYKTKCQKKIWTDETAASRETLKTY